MNSTAVLHLLSDQRIATIMALARSRKSEKRRDAVNILTLSSYNSYRENFHSDIIACLLNCAGPLPEAEIVLRKFFDYLRSYLGYSIRISNYSKLRIDREPGRIDILIADDVKRQAVIIENKINDAPDMKDQLSRYYRWCRDKDYSVTAILYLTLDGVKQPPSIQPEASKLVKAVAVVGAEKTSLLRGWIEPSLETVKCIETHSLLYQYRSLLRHLGGKAMDRRQMDLFYEIWNQKRKRDTIAKLSSLSRAVPEYRADRLQESIKNYAPFRYSTRYGQGLEDVLFLNYDEGPNSYKIDVIFNDDSSADVVFSNQSRQNKGGFRQVLHKLEDAGFAEDFSVHEDFKAFHHFEVRYYASLRAMDRDVVRFIF